MGKSLIYTVNNAPQTVDANGIVNPGTIIRRYGCNFNLMGNAVTLSGNGYYDITANVVVTPDAVGNITATLLKNGAPIPGATATGSVATVGYTTTLTIPPVEREFCCCEQTEVITLQLSDAATVENYTFKAVRE